MRFTGLGSSAVWDGERGAEVLAGASLLLRGNRGGPSVGPKAVAAIEEQMQTAPGARGAANRVASGARKCRQRAADVTGAEAAKRRVTDAKRRRQPADARSILAGYHAVGGSCLTLHSSRLRQEPAGEQYSKLVQLIERDIERDSVVDPATKERLVSEYKCVADVDLPLHSCAVCGIRDPLCDYELVSVEDAVRARPWLVCDTEWVSELRRRPTVTLFRAVRADRDSDAATAATAATAAAAHADAADGGEQVEPVAVAPFDLHHTYEHDGRHLHLYPHLVHDGCMHVCKGCRCFTEKASARRDADEAVRSCATAESAAAQAREARREADEAAAAATASAAADPADDGAAACAARARSNASDAGAVVACAEKAVLEAREAARAAGARAHAPAHSLAASVDYGRLRHLEELGLERAPSTLEQLVLSDYRVYQAIVKISVGRGDLARQRLRGAAICFPQHAVQALEEAFSESRLRSALEAFQFVFVGAKGARGALEKRALLLPDCRLNARVLYNFWALRAALTPPGSTVAALPGDSAHDALERIRQGIDRVAAGKPIGEELIRRARCIEDDSVDLAAQASDISNARAAAWGHDHAAAIEKHEGGWDDQCGPNIDLQRVGVVEGALTPAETMLRGLERLMASEGADGGDGRNGSGDGRDDSGGADADVEAAGNRVPAAGAPAAGEHTVRIGIDEEPVNDYRAFGTSLMGAFWHHFLLGSTYGVASGLLDKRAARHLLLFHDVRFASDPNLVFYAANAQMRIDVNRSVGARVLSSHDAFEQFSALVNDPGFADLLRRAQLNPEGEEAQTVFKRVLPFINLCGRSVKWGATERASEITRFWRNASSSGRPSVTERALTANSRWRILRNPSWRAQESLAQQHVAAWDGT